MSKTVKFVVTIDESSCGGCGECSSVCPCGVLAVDGGRSVLKRPEACIGCGHCFAICPVGAITFNGTTASDVPAVSDPCPVAYSDMAALMRSRRSVRRYKKEKIPRAELEAILADCRYAPTACNAMGNAFVVVSDDAALKEVCRLTREALRASPMAARAETVPDSLIISGSQLLIACGSTLIQNPVDSVILAEEFDMLAQTKGIGCCWAGFVTAALRSYPPLREFLKGKGLNVDAYSFGAMSIGYPDVTYARVPPRITPKVNWL